MTIFRVPTFEGTLQYTYTVQFDGETYRMALTWNVRSQSWYLDIGDDNDVEIISGVRVTVDYPLAFRTRDPAAVPGMFFAVSLSDDNSDPGETDLGQRVRMIYFDESEIPDEVTSGLNLVTVVTP